MALLCTPKLTSILKWTKASCLVSRAAVCGVPLSTPKKDNVRNFHTTDVSSGAKKRITLKWTDIPQPALKPIGPEDYNRWRYYLEKPPVEIPELPQPHNSEEICRDLFDKINRQIEGRSHGRLFAVVHITGKQFKVTAEDIIVIQNLFEASIGDTILLEKVLLLGSSDFTLIGKPLLNKDLVRVEATVIEQTLSHVMPIFRFIKRAHHRRLNFLRIPFTMLRINSIELLKQVDEVSDVEGIENRIVA